MDKRNAMVSHSAGRQATKLVLRLVKERPRVCGWRGGDLAFSLKSSKNPHEV